MERFARAKAAGFEAVELLDPFEVPAAKLRNAVATHGLEMVLINCPAPGSGHGAAVPGSEFRAEFRRTLRAADVIGPQFIHIMAGHAKGAAADACFRENLRWAAEVAGEQRLTIEPLNGGDWPGYFLNDYDQAREISDDIGAPNLHLQFDAYHVHRIHGDVLSLWHRLKDVTAHVQVAQVPDRSEPDGGVIDYPRFFAQLDADGYPGWVSGEYRPATTTEAGLSWIAPS